MEDFQYSPVSENYAGSSLSTPISRPSNGKSSGITLVLPPFKIGRPVKGGKKGKTKNGSAHQDLEVRKIPRAVKLKPLKEVLTKLITQIKKKDDYAFFISPVDTSLVPGYADLIKRPMDFGTMTVKVNTGKYRSLEDFTSDFRLVTGNAKAFNPAGTIYYSEAERIEAWGLEHITKAAATVIEYEMDWNIEIEQDEEPSLNVDEDDDRAHTMSPMDVDGSAAASPAPSLMTPVTQTKRGPRGPYKKGTSTAISECIDVEGRLPGSKDGLGDFPPGSDWANWMLALKLKGKRYRTKKERIKMEKGGPPYCADGSLDYSEMEDPFSILSVFVPDPPSRPQVTPLYAPLSLEDAPDGSLAPATNVPLKRPFPELSTKNDASLLTKKRRHWTVVRNALARGKTKDKDEENPNPTWKVARDAGNTDYGSFGALPYNMAGEMGVKDISSALGSRWRMFNAIRRTVENKVEAGAEGGAANGEEYWTNQRAAEAEEYITDVVFGGIDGWAYVRSLAAFVQDSDSTSEMPYSLGKPLIDYVSETILEPVTEGRHSALREIASHLYNPTRPLSSTSSSQLSASLTSYPPASNALNALHQIFAEHIDITALTRNAAELYVAENEWAGAAFKEERRRQVKQEREQALEESLAKNAAEYLALAIQSHKEDEAPNGSSTSYEGADVVNHALAFSADAILEANKRISENAVKVEHASPMMENGSAIGATHAEEDPSIRRIRLNLIALSKRATADNRTSIPANVVT